MNQRTITWKKGADYETCKAAFEKGKFDNELAKKLAREMDKARPFYLKLGYGLSWGSSLYFDTQLNKNPKLQDLSDQDAKVLYIAASTHFFNILKARDNEPLDPIPGTVNITPLPQRLPQMIAFYESLNNVGKLKFILTIVEEDREPFISAYQEHHNKKTGAKAA